MAALKALQAVHGNTRLPSLTSLEGCGNTALPFQAAHPGICTQPLPVLGWQGATTRHGLQANCLSSRIQVRELVAAPARPQGCGFRALILAQRTGGYFASPWLELAENTAALQT